MGFYIAHLVFLSLIPRMNCWYKSGRNKRSRFQSTGQIRVAGWKWMRHDFACLSTQVFCSHPLHVEDEMQDGIGVKKAAIRKLEHELGIPLTTFNVGSFRYIGSVLYKVWKHLWVGMSIADHLFWKASSDVNWAEFELDHILLARGDINVQVNSNEVAEYAYVSKNALDGILRSEDRLLSPWFRLIARSQLPIWWDNLDILLEKDDAKPVIYDMR